MCSFRYAPRDVGKARGDALAGELRRVGDGRIVGHAEGQLAAADAQLQPREHVGAGFGDQVAAGDAHVDRPFGTEDGDVVGPQEGDVDRHLADAGKQAPLLPAEAQPGLLEQLAGQFAEPAFAGNADAQIGHGNSTGRE